MKGSHCVPGIVDVIYVNGYGFPGYRGGPMFFADRVGLQKIHDRIATFHREHGDRWKPAPLPERLAKTGKTFSRNSTLERMTVSQRD